MKMLWYFIGPVLIYIGFDLSNNFFDLIDNLNTHRTITNEFGNALSGAIYGSNPQSFKNFSSVFMSNISKLPEIILTLSRTLVPGTMCIIIGISLLFEWSRELLMDLFKNIFEYFFT